MIEMVLLLCSYAAQSNDVETGNNVILPMEQNIREENIENAVVNNFKSPRRSLRLTRNNEDMSNKNIPESDNSNRDVVVDTKTQIIEPNDKSNHITQDVIK
eukprot:XP_016656310.1 PREDICTED: uncharacterized protein LOC107882467 [Acyrthosiphon pisum]